MTEKEKLLAICQQALEAKGLNDEIHNKRLSLEMREIDAQNESAYFLDLYDKKVKYAENENNLVVPYLLGVVDQIDINDEPVVIFGDFPDIDIDFISLELRDYLKNVWAPEAYGQEYVCSIGSYNTFGIRSALQSMARVYGKSRHEIVGITTNLEHKDEDGNLLTWDKALETYPEVKKYCEENPEVADAAKRLLNRNNLMGKHAGGLIISSKRIDNFVPLVKRKGVILSAWVEGLHGQDLSPVGLIKFDLLVVDNLMQIAEGCRLVKERHNMTSICALPGQKDWSDTAYLDDRKALAMANQGDLKCIFQFDSDGIRAMVKEGGVDSFNDLVAYTSLYRPSSMQQGMHTAYINRKRGKETFEVHPLLEKIIGHTYGVMCFQESVLQVLNIVGDIPLKDCEILRKAISKKNEEYFGKYKEQFIRNGQKNLGWTSEQVANLFTQIENWAGYGFNLSHSTAYCYISARLIWLKAHYPLEFFAAIFSCEDQTEKLKEYKHEAERHNIQVMPIDINKSGVKFQIVGKMIYFGLSNIKGIGKAVAQRIVDGQPYSDFTDFLTRFGTDASVLKPLLGLKVFGNDTISLYRYFEWFKKNWKKKTERRKRYEKKCQELQQELQRLLPTELAHLATFSSLEEIKAVVDTQEIEELFHTYKVREERYLNNCPEVSEFVPDEIELNEKLVAIYSSEDACERAYYGFLWRHPLEKSPDYEGNLTFERFRIEHVIVGPVECMIMQADKKLAKNKKTTYYLLKVEDSNSEVNYIQVWDDDWERFGEDLVEGQLVKIQIKAPDGGFRRYTLNSPPRHKRHTLPSSKEADFRVCIMGKSCQT